MICRVLKHFSEILSFPFLRVHKSHIINTNLITSYQKGNGGFVTLTDGAEVDISPNYKEEFLRVFKY